MESEKFKMTLKEYLESEFNFQFNNASSNIIKASGLDIVGTRERFIQNAVTSIKCAAIYRNLLGVISDSALNSKIEFLECNYSYDYDESQVSNDADNKNSG